ncbi:sugar ABC transporter ATP-binding protein, partial [Klebsiella pneumoniae]|nr:sugar ABC transporter ATP-binding protein [Klebsiella pneumoniae]
ILYISHKLHEIRALCDTATILRGGKLVDTCDPKQETSRSMAEKMIGAGLRDIVKNDTRDFGPPKLVVNRLSTLSAGHFDIPVDRVSFTVRAG